MVDRDQALLRGLPMLLPPLHVAPPEGWSLRLPSSVHVVTEAPDRAGNPSGWFPRIEFIPGSASADINLSGSCIEEFTRLATAPPDEFGRRVADFALRWGVLGICRHRTLWGHFSCSPLWLWEPLEAWHRYSTHLGAVLRVAESLQAGVPGSQADWDAIKAVDPSDDLEPLISDDDLDFSEKEREERDLASGIYPERFLGNPPRLSSYVPADVAPTTLVGYERRAISSVVRQWFQRGGVGVRPIQNPDDVYLKTHLQARGLAGLLAMQMAAALSSPLFICAGCSNAFTPPVGARRPPRGRRAWCPSCGRAAQWRDYQKRRYERLRSEREG